MPAESETPRTSRKNPAVQLGPRFLIGAAAFVIVVGGMKAAESILVPFLLSAFLAVLAAPAVFWLSGRGVPAAAAVMLVVIGMLGIGSGMGTLVGSSINDFTRSLPTYQERLQTEMASWFATLEAQGVPVGSVRSQLLDSIDPGAAMELVGRLLSGLGGVLTNTFLILLTVIFMLMEAVHLPAKVRAALGDPKASFGGFEHFTKAVGNYLAIKTVVSLITGAAVAVWVWALGVDFPFLWGLIAFLLNYIPNIGSIIAAVPAVLLALIQLGLGAAVGTAAGYVGVNVVMGNVVEPKLLGRGLGLSTLVVFLSLVFWGWVLGTVGMLLSVPLTMSVKIALEGHPSTRWVAVLLGTEAAAQDLVEVAEASTTTEESGAKASRSRPA